MSKRLKPQDRAALESWNDQITAIKESSHVDFADSTVEIETRKKRLEADDEAWFAYYFEQYYTCAPAPFHIAATNRIMNNRRWYEARAWARELAKSARSMMETIKLALTGQVKNVLLISNSADNAERLLLPFMANFEANQRIIQDYGVQKMIGSWEVGEFITKCGCAFRAIGAGQSPRGTRNKNYRPDMIIIDDIDTDEECRNTDRITDKWKWIEEAVIFTMSVSGNYRVIFNGNIIATDCCMIRAIAKAQELQQKGRGYAEIINIRDEYGVSVWSRNSEDDIDVFLSLVSTSAAQKEFFNNPIVEGEIFKDITYGKVPPLSKFKFLVIYGDPAPGENKAKDSSTKAVFLLGKLKGKLYVINGFLDRGLNSEFIMWYVKLMEYVGGKTTVYNYMENNKLQDPFFKQVFQPIVRKLRRLRNLALFIRGDEEKKTEKATRIEANLEPLNREGDLIFNEAEKDNPHFKRLEVQFRLFTLKLKYPADGPDCVEGALRIIDQKQLSSAPPIKVSSKTSRNSNKHRM